MDNAVVSTFSMIGSLVLILLVLVLAYYVTRWYARRVGGAGVGAGRHIKVIEKTVLNPGTSLAIVEIGGKHYLLGVGDKNVRLLSELPEEFGQSVSEVPPEAAAPFSQVFREMWDKTRKKDDDKRR
jgi:flagellar biosynthetic protein FliO